ncbi:hypothetical protein BDEG_24960 [Batrachochytrium dendrobatidis JEL423]|uniref:Uncharacterized protein n=1 Tax=Batrachochytrium dendrobatidis (strain JEL423) TaxID=403673 RepID=A0A177WMJ6_BATDL|nr:hypothetical protein BDEG_24960 [Batrachochytrium dendrobatidis JEL423]
MRLEMSQDLIGCKAAAEISHLNSVYGIVTNYMQLNFLHSLDEKIGLDEQTSTNVLTKLILKDALVLILPFLSERCNNGKCTVSSVINSDTLVSPVPYTMSHIWTHMDTNATIKNQLSFTSPNCQPTIVLMDQRTNAKSPAHQTVYWT